MEGMVAFSWVGQLKALTGIPSTDVRMSPTEMLPQACDEEPSTMSFTRHGAMCPWPAVSAIRQQYVVLSVLAVAQRRAKSGRGPKNLSGLRARGQRLQARAPCAATFTARDL
jgi:hypothetical protein